MREKTDPNMGIIEFGQQLLETGDLDPIYIMIEETDWKTGTELSQYLIAYWCFYHAGTAASICSSASNSSQFWDRMEQASLSYGNKVYPRGTERRHFRGMNGINTVKSLQCVGSPAEVLAFLTSDNDSLSGTAIRCKQIKGFGPWITFKIADMLERLALAPIQFVDDDIFQLFESPAEAAEMVWCRYRLGGNQDGPCNRKVVLDFLREALGHYYDAPPRYERKVNVQEFETVLCKWKSLNSGHYYVGKDIEETRHGLKRFATCPLAQRLRRSLDKGLSRLQKETPVS